MLFDDNLGGAGVGIGLFAVDGIGDGGAVIGGQQIARAQGDDLLSPCAH